MAYRARVMQQPLPVPRGPNPLRMHSLWCSEAMQTSWWVVWGCLHLNLLALFRFLFFPTQHTGGRGHRGMHRCSFTGGVFPTACTIHCLSRPPCRGFKAV